MRIRPDLWLRAVLRRAKQERELDEELRYHLEKETERNLAHGLSPGAARRAALRTFGSVDQIKEQSRDARGVRLVDELRQDTRHALRTLHGSAGYTLVCVLTMALAVGASTTIFGVVNQLLLRPLPFRESNRLALITSNNAEKGLASAELTAADLADYRSQVPSFTDIAALRHTTVTVTDRNEPQRLEAVRVSGNFFELLGIDRPRVGRMLGTHDDAAGAPRVVVLSHGYWSRLGANAQLVGGVLRIDGEPHQIVGVLTERFAFPRGNAFSATPDLWLPLALDATAATDRGNHVLLGIGRLRADMPFERANSELSDIAHRLAMAYPETNAGWSAAAVPLRSAFVGESRDPVLFLFAGALLLLLIAVANLASLNTTRAVAREREVAVRLALGASRGRVLRQQATENLMLSAFGGVGGLLLAFWGTRILGSVDALRLPSSADAPIDARVLAFAGMIMAGTAVVFTIVSATKLAHADTGVLRDRSIGGSRASHRVRNALVVAQVALATTLLAGAGLITRSYLAVTRVQPGFDTTGLVALEIPLPTTEYDSPEKRRAFFDALLERVRALPDVMAVGAISQLPMGGSNSSASFLREADVSQAGMVPPASDWRAIDAHYLQTMRIPLLAGRHFNPQDRADAAPVLLVSDAAARRFWPGENPIGRHITFVGDTVRWEIVGRVADVKHFGLEAQSTPLLYLPYGQADVRRLNLVVRGAHEQAATVAAVRRVIRELDPDQPVARVTRLDELVAASTGSRKSNTILMTGFATAALMLANLGLYGVIAYGVRLRQREIATRIALGARAIDVIHMVVRAGVRLAAMGLGAGVLGTLAAAHAIEAMLYGVPTNDPVTFLGIVLLIGCATLIACFIPARRATHVDPMGILRSE